MKVTSIVAFAAVAVASVHATGLTGSTCEYGTPAPSPTVAPTPGPTSVTPTPTPEPTTVTPPPATPVDCELYNAVSDPSPWSSCADDGTGAFYRTKVLGIKTPAENSGKACPAETDDVRKAKELCPAEKCVPLPIDEDKGDFGACQVIDGKYVKSKILGVKEPAKNGGTCLDSDRTYSVPCEAVDCVPFTKDEDKGEFGECKDNGSNQFFKSKVLGIKTPAEFGGKECESDEKRTVSEVCEPVNCVAVPVGEDTGAYGECVKDETSGKYIKSKVLAVKDEAKYGGTCDTKDRTVTAPCDGVDCVPYTSEEDPGQFGECSDDGSGKFKKSKILGIKVPAKFGGLCSTDEERRYAVDCDAVNCVVVKPEDDKGVFGACAKDDVSGKYVKTKLLGIEMPAQYGGTCLDADRLYSEPCAAVDCVPYKLEEDPGQFGECKDNGSNQFFKSKVLGIKIPAEYGGAECESEAKRTVELLCEPVNCVPKTALEDPGDFGVCEKNAETGKYAKSRVLGVKEPAKNGGTCLDKDRTIYEECPAVNCEAYTEATDPGQFGECTVDSIGKFYKSKVLGIKTPAEYGGLECESDEQRTVSEFCPPVNCVPFNVAEDDGEYGACKFDAVANKWVKSKVLGVKEEAKNGGTCEASDRTVEAPCAGIDCVVLKPEEDEGDFGACAKGEDSDVYYKSKVLGIKTDALYGGLCPAPADRTYKVVCPAVNCVAVKPEDDTGAFGDCKKDEVSNKWVKAKVLEVKDAALYGGTCDPKDRTVYEECKAVDCVAFEATEDKGEFGDCEDNGAGVFFKSKVLGIKTPAQYGGAACLPESERVFKELCPAENCVSVKEEDDKGDFGVCEKETSSNKYYKYKVLAVQTPAKNGGTCLPKDRTVSELCPAVNCEAYTEETDSGQFGECTVDSIGKFYKSKVLGIKIPAEYGGLECESDEQRTVSEFCPPVNCVPFNVAEDDGEYGACTLKAGTNKWVKSKVLGVKEEAKNGGTCEASDRTVEAPCAGIDCVVLKPEEDEGDFGACAKAEDSDVYYKSKVLGIKTEALYGGLCPAPADRTYKVVCPAVNCVAVKPEDDKGAFGDCKKDALLNKWVKSKVLGIQVPAQYGGTCLDSDRTYAEECAAINCVPYTAAEDKGEFGQCVDNGFGAFFKSKVLGVKTAAQYGGAECVPEEQRKVYELCPPVPCVVYTATEDPSLFGPCTKEATSPVYYKSKTLGIKTPALYGGACPATTDASRIVKELCPAVDCVVKKAADDVQPFGNCTLFADGNYYRSKVLPILTEPTNGGTACPTVAERTVKGSQCATSDGNCLPTDPFYDQCLAKLGQCGTTIKDKVYVGNELLLVKGLALWECCDKCTATAGCKAYSFTPNTEDAKKTECSLKWSADASLLTTKTGAISSSPKTVKASPCTFYDNKSSRKPASTIRVISSSTLVACCDECAKSGGCYSFNLDASNKCFLKGYTFSFSFQTEAGWRSGNVV